MPSTYARPNFSTFTSVSVHLKGTYIVVLLQNCGPANFIIVIAARTKPSYRVVDDNFYCTNHLRHNPPWSGGTTRSRNLGVRVREETAARSHGSPCSPCSTSNRVAPSLMNLGRWQISCESKAQVIINYCITQEVLFLATY